MEAEVKGGGKGRRFAGWLIGTLALFALGMAARNVWLARSAVEPGALEAAPAPDWRAIAMRHDPPEGSRLHLPAAADLAGKPVPLPLPEGVTVLMFLRWAEYAYGDITGLERAVRSLPEARPVVVFGKTDLAAARSLVRAEAKRARVVYDRDGRLAEALNMVGKMRYYLLAPDGTLLFAENLLGNGQREEQRARDALRQWVRAHPKAAGR